MSKNSKHDDYILKWYYKKTVRQIAAELGIPFGSVTKRYQIIMGRVPSRVGERINYRQPSMPTVKMEKK